jgi:DNA-binding SARP family transcriptional activator/tetratricopeptide (TPR) repeat protein
MVEFRLLGSVEVSVAGRLVDAGRPRQRTVLAALLVDVGRQVSPEILIDRVWGDAPPRGARRALHAHLTHIRRLLELDRVRPTPLVYRSGGYLLDVDVDAVDWHRFRRLITHGRGADYAEDDRAQRLRAALDLWRGEPLTGLPGDWAARTRQTWLQQRVDTTIAWADAELSIGNGEVTIGPLTELAVEHPLLEPLAAMLLRGLHAAGRSATALDHYATLRQRLADELGADPSVELQAVHQAILRGGGDMLPTRSAPVVVSGQAAPPTAERTLPADVAGFVGRHDELRHLLAAVDTAAADGVRAVAIHAVDGMAGIGKTAFAVHAAHHLASRFPDGQRFVDLRAHAPGQVAVEAAAALEILLQADGVAAHQVPAGLDARAGLWRERMADKKLLLVLDDAADTAHVTPLLPAAVGCLVLITSRRKLATLPGATPLSLDTLPPADAAQLFVNRAGPRAHHDPAAVQQIVHLCGHLPLAITLTAARLHTHPTWSVADLAADLDQARDRLAELASGELAVAAAFDLSYRDLPTDRQRLFRRLALHPGPDFDAYAAAALDQTTQAAARRGLETLLEHNLLTEPHRGRYRFHDLIAAHARTHAAIDPESERDAALDRLLTYYQHAATTAAVYQDVGFTPVSSAESADPRPVEAPPIADAQLAYDWFAAEQSNLAAATHHAAARSHPAAIAIPVALHQHLRDHGPVDLAIRLHHAALTAAQLAGDQPAQARTLINLAHMQRLSGDYPAALTAGEQARTLHRQLGDRRGEADALGTLARVQFQTGDLSGAAGTAEQAYALYLQLGERRGQADALNTLARVEHVTGQQPAAAATAEQARAIHQQLGDRNGQADALETLARVQYTTGDYLAAAGTAEQARTLYQQLGDRRGQANALNTLAHVQHVTGDYPAAAAAAEQARLLLKQLGNRLGQANAQHTLATVQHATGDYAAAAATAERAYTIHRQIGNRHGQANTLQILGVVRHATNDDPAAAAALDQALDLFREVGDPDGEAETLNHIGQLLLDSATPAAAHQHFGAALDIARRIGTPTHEARALEGIGDCLRRQGHHNDAIRHLREALAIYQRIYSPNTTRLETALRLLLNGSAESDAPSPT